MERRRYLALAGTSLVPALGGCLGGDGGSDGENSSADDGGTGGNESGGDGDDAGDAVAVSEHLDGANGYDGDLQDRRENYRVSVDVDAGGSGDWAYDPAAVRVEVGTTVRWELPTEDHTVTSVDEAFDDPGTYHYQCSEHARDGHRGSVVVDPTHREDVSDERVAPSISYSITPGRIMLSVGSSDQSGQILVSGEHAFDHDVVLDAQGDTLALSIRDGHAPPTGLLKLTNPSETVATEPMEIRYETREETVEHAVAPDAALELPEPKPGFSADGDATHAVDDVAGVTFLQLGFDSATP